MYLTARVTSNDKGGLLPSLSRTNFCGFLHGTHRVRVKNQNKIASTLPLNMAAEAEKESDRFHARPLVWSQIRIWEAYTARDQVSSHSIL